MAYGPFAARAGSWWGAASAVRRNAEGHTPWAHRTTQLLSAGFRNPGGR